jgi:tRNA (cmo5U34)-methyltransferase
MEILQDKIFKTKIEKSSDFKFDESVVNVFNDMVVRSVPLYSEIQRMIAEISQEYACPGSSIYDLGCSTGTTLIALDKVVDSSARFVGVDESKEMLDKCKTNFVENNPRRQMNVVHADLNHGVIIDNASVVILCLTLQFVRPINRPRLLQSVYKQLQPGGALILVEKILCENSAFNRQFIKYYYKMKKRNNYNEMEIAQKREALENVLIPYKISENIQMLEEAKFKSSEVFFKWYNFAGIVATK